jgi:aerobic carbon-monoxide dehydrogenase small subunit
MSEPPLDLTVNGRRWAVEGVPGEERLLDTLRWRLDLKGTKEGCRSGDCGACTVLVDGRSTLSCLVLSQELAGRGITTIEGVEQEPEGPAVRRAFAEEPALQCGYCTPGFILALVGLRRELGPDAPAEELLAGLAGNLCRCTGYGSIARAVARLREDPR